MTDKLGFYEKYGVEEYYVYDPDNIKLTGHLRNDGKLKAIAEMNGWVSPRLGVRFDLSGPELQLFGPDGKRFLTYQELVKERDRVTAERDRATAERDRATAERDRITAERDAERERNERLVAHFRALGIEPPA
jgi:hypothetical protein